MPPRRLGPKSEPPGRAAVVAFAVAWYGLMYVWATSDSGALVGTVAAFALIYLFGRIMEGPPRRRSPLGARSGGPVDPAEPRSPDVAPDTDSGEADGGDGAG